MKLKILMTWHVTLVVAAAVPGGLDTTFAPEFRAAAAAAAILAPDGKPWVCGGFDEAGGAPVGDWVVLGPDGGVERDAVPGYLKGWPSAFAVPFNGSPLSGISLGSQVDLFPLAGGACLIPTGSSGWLRVNAAGAVVGSAFPDLAAGESLAPQFERDGKLVVIRTFGDGRVVLEMRDSGDGGIVPSFAQSEDIPADPVAAVAGPDGKLWVLGSSPRTAPASSLSRPPAGVDVLLFRLEGSGAVDVGIVPNRLPSFRSHSLATGPAGAVRVVMGPDRLRWNYWPAPETSVYRLEFRGAAGNLQRLEDFSIPHGTRFAWAENAEGKVVATGADGRLVAWTGTGVLVATGGGTIYHPYHLVDSSFTSPGRVMSVKALPDGKWLVDGSRRLRPDGTDDPTWTVPRLDRPQLLQPDGLSLDLVDKRGRAQRQRLESIHQCPCHH